ncbi:hypothetical protein [uncultured Sphingomonas sp.]|uniref:hypothetical protein n=1 Tax=uncultured Sphingomonas sp. TaxID=158754 RepID=UPI0035C9E386
MTNFARRIAALAFTTVTSALLLVAAVGPVHTPVRTPTHAGTPVAHSARFMA